MDIRAARLSHCYRLFVPFIANYGVFLAITLFLASLTVYVRYVLIQ